jgi:transcription antitermination factor NusG
MSETLPWFAVVVAPRKEKAAARAFEARGYESFLPLYTEKRKWSDRVKPVEFPLFPGYVFARFDPVRRLPILKMEAVLEIVSLGPEPQQVDPREIAALQKVCESGINSLPCPYLTAGAKVTIREGPLKGAEGILVEDSVDATGAQLVLSVTLLQRSISVQVDRDWVTPRRVLHTFERDSHPHPRD